MKFVVFGTGLYYQNRKQAFEGVNVVAFLDNAPEKQGTMLSDVPVVAPETIKQMDYDYICIMSSSKFYGEMLQQLVSLGVPENKVVPFELAKRYTDAAEKKDDDQTYNVGNVSYATPHGWKMGKGRRVLIITHELSLSGAPVVLLYMANVLKQKGLQPIVLSPQDGKLKQKFINEGIPVVVDANISGENPLLLEWMKTFDLIVVCTLTFGHFIGEISGDFPKPILWWLHEGTEVYSGWWPRVKPAVIGPNVHIYTGGVRAMQVYKQYFKNDDAKMLLYGIPDENMNPGLGYRRKSADGKIVFALVAVIQPRKGQDLFLDAIKLLPPEDRQKAEFWLVGPYTDQVYPEFNEKLRQDAANIPEVSMKGEWPMEKLLAEYENIDVMVCPSRDDPMPVVLPEAMMFFKTCICSVESGTSYFIKDKENGLICEVDPASIADKIHWVIHNMDKLPQMGVQSRQLFEETFSLDAFENNLMQAVADCTGEA